MSEWATSDDTIEWKIGTGIEWFHGSAGNNDAIDFPLENIASR